MGQATVRGPQPTLCLTPSGITQKVAGPLTSGKDAAQAWEEQSAPGAPPHPSRHRPLGGSQCRTSKAPCPAVRLLPGAMGPVPWASALASPARVNSPLGRFWVASFGAHLIPPFCMWLLKLILVTEYPMCLTSEVRETGGGSFSPKTEHLINAPCLSRCLRSFVSLLFRTGFLLLASFLQLKRAALIYFGLLAAAVPPEQGLHVLLRLKTQAGSP